MASMIITTLVLLGPSLLLLRRWRVPFGAMTLIFTGYGLLVNIMTEYRDMAADHPADAHRPGDRPDPAPRAAGERLTLGGIRTIGPIAAAVLWISYYAVLALDKGIGWEPTLWVGALMVGRADRLRRRVPDRAAVLRPAPRGRLRRLELLDEERATSATSSLT